MIMTGFKSKKLNYVNTFWYNESKYLQILFN